MKLNFILLAVCITAALVAEPPAPAEQPGDTEQNAGKSPSEEEAAKGPPFGHDSILFAFSVGPGLMFFNEHAKISVSTPTLDFSATTDFNATYFGFGLDVFSSFSASHFHLAQSIFAGGGVGDVESNLDISGGVNLPKISVSLDSSQVDTNFLITYAVMPGFSFYPSERSAVNISLGVDFTYLDFAVNGVESATYSMGFPARLSVATVIGKGLWLDGGLMVMANPLIRNAESEVNQNLGTSQVDTSKWGVTTDEHYYLGLTLFIRLGGALWFQNPAGQHADAKPSTQEEQAST